MIGIDARKAAAHLFTLGVLALWAGYAALVPAYLCPGPLQVGRKVVEFFVDPRLAAHVGASLGHVAAALVLSFLIGGSLAVLAHYVSPLRLMVHGRLSPFLNSFSGIGWTLLAIIWFGLNGTAVIFAVTAILVPFAIINVRAGLDNLNAELVEMGRSFGHGWRPFAKIVVPSLYPFLFATLRINFGVSWKVALTAELFGGNSGLGYVVNLARQAFDTAQIFAVIVLIVLFVYGADRLVFGPLQARLARHYADA
jgi:NitT/TauT family transport system permease protein/sulfonate transport system permease protein